MPSKGAVGVYVGGINASGDASGFYYTDAKYAHAYGFIRQADGTIAQIDVPNSKHHHTYAGPIDGEDDVTGYYESSDKGVVEHGFLSAPDGTITTFDGPGAYETLPNDINARVIVGSYYTYDANHAFMRSADGTITTIDYPGASATYAYSLNSSGRIAGVFDDDVGRHGFVRQTDGSFSVIDPPQSVYTDNLEINDKGEVTGIYENGSNMKYSGFLLKGGKFYTFARYFGRMNSRNQSVGQTFLLTFTNGQFSPKPIKTPRGCSNLFLSGINDSSIVAGAMECPRGKAGWYGYLLQE
ncbi:MAG TPA: hypothetical protein VGL35_03580 [Rhizomicrobium sp.]